MIVNLEYPAGVGVGRFELDGPEGGRPDNREIRRAARDWLARWNRTRTPPAPWVVVCWGRNRITVSPDDDRIIGDVIS